MDEQKRKRILLGGGIALVLVIGLVWVWAARPGDRVDSSVRRRADEIRERTTTGERIPTTAPPEEAVPSRAPTPAEPD